MDSGDVEAELDGKAVVKVSWTEADAGWTASFDAVDDDGFVSVPLEPGVEFDLELTGERRCTGYFSDVGERRPCPEYREIESGGQCSSCRRRDVFTGYVEGRRGADVADDVEFGVYLARCGSAIKVGVTRTAKLRRRWVEQGADEAVAYRSGLSSREALALESRLSKTLSVPERIRKEDKVSEADVDLETFLRSRDVEAEGDIVNVSVQTVYPPLNRRSLSRTGRFSGVVESVKGQIVSFEPGPCVGVSSGRVLVSSEQRGLDDF